MSLTLELVDFEYNTLSSLSGWALSISWKPKENKKTSLPPSKRESRSKRLWTWIEMLPFLDFCPLAGPPSSFWTCRRKLPYICIVQSFSRLWLRNPVDFSTPDFPFFTISKSCSLSWWCHPTISFSATHFAPCSQCFPASRTLDDSLHQVAKILEHQLQYQSFQWIVRLDFL